MDEGLAGGHELDERSIEVTGVHIKAAYLDRDTGVAQLGDASAGYLRERIHCCREYSTDASRGLQPCREAFCLGGNMVRALHRGFAAALLRRLL